MVGIIIFNVNKKLIIKTLFYIDKEIAKLRNYKGMNTSS